MNTTAAYVKKAQSYLNTLCSVKPNRRTGSAGNRQATDFFIKTIEPFGYNIDSASFGCLDFMDAGAFLSCGPRLFEVFVSPYSLGTLAGAQLVTVSTLQELETCRCAGDILLMRGELCAEPLMPKNFVFYNPDSHKRIYSLLEEKMPSAIITATGRNPDMAGALYPFPLIEDGAFDIPSVYCTDVTGNELAALTGEIFQLVSTADRIYAKGCNVLARKNPESPRKITVCAHIDAYGNSPGAADNASGAVVLLLLAEMLDGYKGDTGIELLALNGEDNYSAAGQMDYLRRYLTPGCLSGEELALDSIKGLNPESPAPTISPSMGETGERVSPPAPPGVSLAINIDDVGFIRGRAAYSFYNCPDELQRKAAAVFGKYPGLVQGEPWPQGDHMIFVQKGIPAIAFTSENVKELMSEYTHTCRDTPDIVDCRKVVEVAEAVGGFIEGQ